MKFWQVALLVAAGVAYSILEPGQLRYAFGYATLYIFLPPLLFEAAWSLNLHALRRQWRAIAWLAGPGVIVTATVIASSLSVVRVPFGVALLTGTILSATDPIAVIALFRRIRIPVTLATIIESEALFNDGAAVVAYRVVLAILASTQLGGHAIATHVASLAGVVAGAVFGAAGGIALGTVIAFAVALLLRVDVNPKGRARLDLQILVTIFCAYASYFLADWLHCSGVFATIASGIALRRFERAWITLTIAADVNAFWSIGAFLANAFVFFLVGAALRAPDLVHDPIFIIATIVGVVLARGIVAGLLLPSGFPRKWFNTIRIAGMRGPLSLALAIALPASTPYRVTIIDATFATVLLGLAFGGSALFLQHASPND